MDNTHDFRVHGTAVGGDRYKEVQVADKVGYAQLMLGIRQPPEIRDVGDSYTTIPYYYLFTTIYRELMYRELTLLVNKY